MIGILYLAAVAISFIFILKQPSPAILITVLSFLPTFAPIQAPNPNPIVPNPPEERNVLGALYL